MKREICENCKYYIQHYGLHEFGGVYKIFCGHCLKQQSSKKECTHFEQNENVNKTDSFIFHSQVKKMLYASQSLSQEINCIISTLKQIFECLDKTNK